jgi:myo-inositol-1(or 4)-monophosphatase
MSMVVPDINRLGELVSKLASEELMPEFGKSGYAFKDDGSVVTPADFAMQERLETELKRHWPEFDMLGEEMPLEQQQDIVSNSSAYWCIDPLDGTSNYASGIPCFAVSIALIVDGQQQLGLIYDPVKEEMFAAIRGQGASLNGNRMDYLPADQPSKPVVAEIDLKRLPEDIRVKLVTDCNFASQRNFGSSAIDWAWMAAGRFDVYLHGGQKLWDYAAGSLIFNEAGGRCISLDGGHVFRGKLEKRSVLASYDDKLFASWSQWLNLPL